MNIEGYVLTYEHDGRFQKLSLGKVPNSEPIAYLKIEGEDVAPLRKKGSHASFEGLICNKKIGDVPLYERNQEVDTTVLLKDKKTGDLEKVCDTLIPSTLPPNWEHRLELAALVLIGSDVTNIKPDAFLDTVQQLALKLYGKDKGGV